MPNYISHLDITDLKIAFHNHCVTTGLSKAPQESKKHWEPFWEELSKKCNVIPLRDRE